MDFYSQIVSKTLSNNNLMNYYSLIREFKSLYVENIEK